MRNSKLSVASCELSVDFCQLSVGFCQLLFLQTTNILFIGDLIVMYYGTNARKKNEQSFNCRFVLIVNHFN